MARDSILIVEDSPLSAKLAGLLFASEDFDVRLASNAREALAELGRFRPDIVLIDLQLPEVDGYELARRIRSNPAWRKVVVLATSADRYADLDRISSAGCDGFVAKPIEVERVRAIASLAAGATGAAGRVEDRAQAAEEPRSSLEVARSIRRATRKLGLDGWDPRLEQYLSRSAADLAELRRAVADGDAQRTGWIAHRLAGLSGMLGAARVARACLELERRAKAGPVDDLVTILLGRLAGEIETVHAAFDELKEGDSAI